MSARALGMAESVRRLFQATNVPSISAIRRCDSHRKLPRDLGPGERPCCVDLDRAPLVEAFQRSIQFRDQRLVFLRQPLVPDESLGLPQVGCAFTVVHGICPRGTEQPSVGVGAVLKMQRGNIQGLERLRVPQMGGDSLAVDTTTR